MAQIYAIMFEKPSNKIYHITVYIARIINMNRHRKVSAPLGTLTNLILAKIGYSRIAVEHHSAGNGYKLCIHHGSISLDTPSVGGDAVGISVYDSSAVCIKIIENASSLLHLQLI